jgi:Tol biopolymer transport system component
VTLAAGTRLGPYEILSAIGAGGMGEVYRGRDSRLDRLVAVKVLPAHLHGNADLRERFDREARAVSSLTHPHICALYDVGHQNGTDFLVMELLEGETLADRLEKGPLPADQALRYGIEIADALSAAHRQGIVHRDLKPGNVMVTKAGAKLLDFGLARTGVAAATGAVTALPTTPANLTAQGTILGTFQYMAPEQLEGQEADARTDIFAFGALLFEMITGRRAFEGRTQANLISAIMTSAPPSVSSVQPLAPPSLDYAISRCLAKDPDDRWQSARDLAAELRRVAGRPQESSGVTSVGRATAISSGAVRSRERAAWGIAGVMTLALAALAGWLMVGSGTEESVRRPAHLAISLAPAETLGGMFTLSPDGSRLAFVGRAGQRMQLFVRPLDRDGATPLGGTENMGVVGATFSPDGKWLAFVADSRLKKVSIDGGSPMVLALAAAGGRPAWGSNDVIVFSNPARGLSQVLASGGGPKILTTPDTKSGEVAHEMPLLLPDGKTLLFDIRRTDATANSGVTMIVSQSLETGERRPLFPGMPLALVDSGHLLFARDASVYSVAFDPNRVIATAEPTMAFPGMTRVEQVLTTLPMVSASRSGAIVYLPERAGSGDSQLVLVARDGVARPISVPAHRYSDPRVSPDGGRLAMHVFEDERENWVSDLRRGGLMRLTFDPGEDETPIWAPDGRSILYTSTRSNVPRAIIRKPADGSGVEQILWKGDSHLHLGGITPDGETLVVSIANGQQTDITAISVRDGKVTPVVTSPFRNANPALSPDGRWLAYTSDESGRPEVYVQPFPTPSGRSQVSTAGGTQPVWARNGRELFYRGSGKMMSVDVGAAGSFSPSAPRALFDDRFDSTQGEGHTCYDVMPDGKNFIMVTKTSAAQGAVTHLNIVLDWLGGGQRTQPGAR